jgi:putative transcriptional regulator
MAAARPRRQVRAGSGWDNRGHVGASADRPVAGLGVTAVESLRGQLLIAGANLVDPNFRRTVILVGEHTQEGALGVVLNRPAPATVADVAPPLAPLVAAEDPLFIGGPVQPDAVVLLADLDDPSVAGVPVMGSIGFLVGDVDEGVSGSVRRARVFAGYAGWGPGQLEEELRQDSWIVEPALPSDVFSDEPEGLWSRVLRRKGGRFRLLATMPYDPSLN